MRRRPMPNKVPSIAIRVPSHRRTASDISILTTITDRGLFGRPDFPSSRRACCRWYPDDLARRIEGLTALEDGVREWLEAPGPALLDVVVARNELVMPPKVEVSQVLGTALYSAKAILSGRTTDVIDLAKGALTT
jgi:pyruvate dehydrogenase (quinone)